MSDEPWYVRAFGSEYLHLYAHRSREQGARQVGQMLSANLLAPPGLLLDLCCGAGRHLIPLREAGFAAYGLDLSAEMLRAGNLGGMAVRADAIRLPFRDGCFDAVVNLFSSFGYFPDDASHHRMLAEVRRVLKPGGRLIIDHMNAGPVIEHLVSESREEREGLTVHQKRRYDAQSKRVIKEVEYRTEAGETRRWHESVRLFTPAELDEFIAAAELVTIARHGDLDGSPFDESTSARQVVIAERR